MNREKFDRTVEDLYYRLLPGDSQDISMSSITPEEFDAIVVCLGVCNRMNKCRRNKREKPLS